MWSDDTFITSFDAEAGDISALATSAQKILWFNEGQTRLNRLKQSYYDITWAEGDRIVSLPADFVMLDKIVVDDGVTIQPWREWGGDLTLDDPEGASALGTARVYYKASFTEMTTSTSATDLTQAQDYACLYYALSRFFKRLSSNRLYYKRYSTLVGQNNASTSDLQQESDRYYQDFLEAREDLPPEPPAYFYSE